MVPHMPVRFGRKGFTIVELLIVIVVIAILAAIVLVGYNGISNNARRSAAASAAEQAAKSVLNYSTLNSEKFPAALSAAGVSNDANTTYEYSYDNATRSYCITATFQAVSYYVSNTQASAVAGMCPGHTGGVAMWTQVSGGYETTCGVYGGKAYCWGANTASGQLGNGGTADAQVPSAVDTTGVMAGLSIAEVATGRGPSGGETHTCALATTGNIYCWGRNDNGTLGNGTTTNSLVPVAVTMSGVLAGKTVASISSGHTHSCALASGQVYCWGRNFNGYGSLGNGSTSNSTVPSAVTTSGVLNGKTVTNLAKSKGLHNCVIAAAKVYCWGYNYFGYLGNNSTALSLVPVAVTDTGVLSGKTVTDVAAGGDFVCVLASGAPYCWGYGVYGSLGNGTNTTSWVPVAVNVSGVLAGKTITSIAAGDDHACVIADGAVYCWGAGGSGRLGNNTTISSNVPVAVDTTGVLAGKTVSSIGLGSGHSCAIASGDLYCWGIGTNGRLGNNATASSSVPVRVTNPS